MLPRIIFIHVIMRWYPTKRSHCHLTLGFPIISFNNQQFIDKTRGLGMQKTEKDRKKTEFDSKKNTERDKTLQNATKRDKKKIQKASKSVKRLQKSVKRLQKRQKASNLFLEKFGRKKKRIEKNEKKRIEQSRNK